METLIIYLKINGYKFTNPGNLQNQIRKVYEYLIIRKKINYVSVTFQFYYVNNDFIENKKTLKITYYLKK